jgi:hypothetical protein
MINFVLGNVPLFTGTNCCIDEMSAGEICSMGLPAFLWAASVLTGPIRPLSQPPCRFGVGLLVAVQSVGASCSL